MSDASVVRGGTDQEQRGRDAAAQAEFAKLREALEEEPFRFEFFQAVRLLQRMEPARSPVGYFVPPGSRFRRASCIRWSGARMDS